MGAVMRELIRRLFGRPAPTQETPASREKEVIRRFWYDPPGVVNELIQMLDEGPAFTEAGGLYFMSPSGRIAVCMDIMGPEVTIHPTRLLLDSHARAYGLTQEEASNLYEAILRQVPASSTYRFRRSTNAVV